MKKIELTEDICLNISSAGNQFHPGEIEISKGTQGILEEEGAEYRSSLISFPIAKGMKLFVRTHHYKKIAPSKKKLHNYVH